MSASYIISSVGIAIILVINVGLIESYELTLISERKNFSIYVMLKVLSYLQDMDRGERQVAKQCFTFIGVSSSV